MQERRPDPTPEEIKDMVELLRAEKIRKVQGRKSKDRKEIGLRQVGYSKRQGRSRADSE